MSERSKNVNTKELEEVRGLCRKLQAISKELEERVEALLSDEDEVEQLVIATPPQ